MEVDAVILQSFMKVLLLKAYCCTIVAQKNMISDQNSKLFLSFVTPFLMFTNIKIA